MPRDHRLVLVACYLAIFAVGENSTAIMAALPAMASGLGLAPATVEWAVNAYLLAAAAFIILGGQAADLFGPRRASAAGIGPAREAIVDRRRWAVLWRAIAPPA